MSIQGFRVELVSLLNRESVENGSNTPDHILAEYLMGCLIAFDKGVTSREKWYGYAHSPGQSGPKKLEPGQ